jgi:surfactin synthase thioesterase subunit
LAFGAADFAGWASVLAADAVECYYVELPGRGLRQSEPAISDAGKLVDALITELLTHMASACNVYIHSSLCCCNGAYHLLVEDLTTAIAAYIAVI